MATYFVKTATITGGSAPNDGNDGKDPIGFGLATATYNDATKTLTQANAFTTYTFTTGDLIAITGGTNATPGLYTIASKVDASNITLTTSAGSTDATGDWTSSDGPWATVGFAADTIVAGDRCRICADGDHTPAAVITSHTANAGTTSTNNVIYTGATARGVVDGTMATLNGDNGNVWSDNNEGHAFRYTTFQYLDFDGNGGTGSGLFFDQLSDGIKVVDCKFHGFSSYGVYCTQSSTACTFIRCEVYGNTTAGFGANGGARGSYEIFDCSFHDNGIGVHCGTVWMHGCLIYDNSVEGVRLQGVSLNFGAILTNNTFQGNGGDGFVVQATTGEYELTIRNNIFSENTGYGINLDGEVVLRNQIGPNVFDNNTAGATSLDGVVDLGATGLDTDNNVASQELDPVFASIADGSENLIPANGNGSFTAGEGGVWQDSEGNSMVGVTYDANRVPYCGAVPPDLTAGGDGAGGGGFIIGG
jgi:hypothetical protein